MPHLVVDEDRISQWTTELTTGQTRWWVVEYDGTIVGFVGIGPSRDPVDTELGELDTIAVDPARWRRGIGTALCERHLTHWPKPASRKPFFGRSPDTTKDKPSTSRWAGPATAGPGTAATKCRSGTISDDQSVPI